MSAPARPLTRAALGVGGPRPPVRHAHFGLGAFHRAHQAWFSAHAGDGADWGICAFSGRGSGLATTLQLQEGLYTLIERSADADRFEVMTNLVEVHEGSDSAAIAAVFARPALAVVTMTVSEAGYRLHLDGTPLDDDELATDVAALSGSRASGRLADLALATVPGRILLGLEARRRVGAGPLALIPCDNLPDNATVLGRGLCELASRVSVELAQWVQENVAFVATSVDRITPRTTDQDVELVRERTRWLDAVPVVTEPFASWVLAGEFPAGRPRWEDAGAEFVDAIEPYERRKLWLLNGAHTILAYVGLATGHTTVADAIADPRCARVVTSYWASATRQLPVDLDPATYCTHLLERFANARIGYQLEQIASDSVMKLRTRIAPVVLAEYRAGRDCPAGVEVFAAWVRRLLTQGSFPDAESLAVRASLEGGPGAVFDLMRLVDPRLLDQRAFVDQVVRRLDAPALANSAVDSSSSSTGEQ